MKRLRDEQAIYAETSPPVIRPVVWPLIDGARRLVEGMAAGGVIVAVFWVLG